MMLTHAKPKPPGREPDLATLRQIGAHLQEARSERREQLADAAAYLRIRRDYLEALEAGDPSRLPGMPYAAGFLRTYARHLGFDPDPLVRAQHEALVDTTPPPALQYPEPPPEPRRNPAASLLAASLVLAAALYTGWYAFLHPALEPADVTIVAGNDVGFVEPEIEPPAPPPVTVAAPVVEPTSPPPTAVAANEPAPVIAHPAEPTPATPPTSPAAQPSPVPDVTSAVAAETARDGTPPVPASTAELLASLEPAQQPAAAPPPARVVLVATEKSWIQVRSADGQFVRTRTMEPGERMELPERTDLALRTGNAGGVTVEFDGASLGPVGARGALVKNFVLAPDVLAARSH